MIDLPAHGRAQPPGATARIVDKAGLVAALLAQERYERAHLVRVSLGALVAQDSAARHPGAVSSLTVVGGYPIFGASPAVQRAQTLALLRLLALLIFSLDRFKRAPRVPCGGWRDRHSQPEQHHHRQKHGNLPAQGVGSR